MIKKIRELAANAADTARELMAGVAANVAPIAEDNDWFEVAPYGVHPHELGEQLFERRHADQIVANFNSVAARLGRLFRGLPVYVGHPDVNPEIWKDGRRLGGLKELRATDHGLEARAAWNSAGRENVTEGFWVYPSPAWYFRRNSAGQLEPEELKSVGLWNDPNIRDAAPVTNANQQTTKKDEIMNKEALIKLLGLAETATDEEIQTAMTAMKEKADAHDNMAAENAKAATEAEAAKRQMDAAKAEKKTAEAAAANANKQAAKLVLDIAANAGRITEADRTAIVAECGDDLAKIEAKLQTSQEAAVNTKSLDLGGRRVAIATSQDRQVAVNTAVAEEMNRNGGDYDAAWKTVRDSEAFKPLFAAMEKPSED